MLIVYFAIKLVYLYDFGLLGLGWLGVLLLYRLLVVHLSGLGLLGRDVGQRRD